METMKELRVRAIMNQLYERLGSSLATMEELMNAYAMHRMANMQVRKCANKCMNDTEIWVNRFYAMLRENKIDEEWCTVKRFDQRFNTFKGHSAFFR